MEIDKIRQFSNEERLKTEIQDKKKQEYTLVGKQRKVPGHILFSYNTVTGEIKQAKLKITKPVINIFSMIVSPGKTETVIEKNCIYRQALNKKSLIKRLKREGII